MTRLSCYKHSFFPSAIKIWNSLPQHVINMTKIEQFKHSLETVQYDLCMFCLIVIFVVLFCALYSLFWGLHNIANNKH